MIFTDSPLISILDNAVLAWGLVACGLAQLSKLFVEIIFQQRWRPAVLLETGGMPSSHSALVTGAAAGVGLEMGFGNSEFALAATLAFVVMYDASGIRRAAGYTAKRVNDLNDKTFPNSQQTPLKEVLGHSRIEVLAGSIVGPAISIPGIVFVGSPLHLFQMISATLG